MEKPRSRRATFESVSFMFIEFLTVTAFILSVITLVAGRYSHSLRGLPILTFDTSSLKTLLTNDGIVNRSKVADWYEPHYLSVCKGSWLHGGGTHVKNTSSTDCNAMPAGYTFSLIQILAADVGLPADSAILSTWSFAVLKTQMAYVCLALAMTFISCTWINYLFCMIFIPRPTPRSSLNYHRVGFFASIAAFITMTMSSAKITASAHQLVSARPVAVDGLLWSTSSFYVLTWFTMGLLGISLIASIILGRKIASQCVDS